MVSANELPWSLLGLPDEFALDHFTLALDTREPDPLEPTMIKTVRSGGYMFTPRVKDAGAESASAAGN